MCIQQIARDAITILINLSTDKDVLEFLASDKEFISTLLERVTVCQSSTILFQLWTDNQPTRIPQNQMRIY
jgi:hypothetical protein